MSYRQAGQGYYQGGQPARGPVQPGYPQPNYHQGGHHQQSYPARHHSGPSLRHFLRDLSAIEVQKYIQEKTILSLKAKSDRLGIKGKISQPEKPVYTLHYADVMDLSNGSIGNYFCLIMWCGFAVFLVMTLIAFLWGGDEWYMGILFALAAAAFLGLCLLPDYFYLKEQERKYERKLAEYRQQMSKDASRVDHEYRIKAGYERQIKILKGELARTNQARNAMYSLGIIHKSYQSMVPVCSFYDYFDKGICTTLEGPSGAYKFYEEALRFKRIEDRMDIIISKLDEIIYNQQQLGQLMREGISTMNRIESENRRMVSTMNDIRDNTALNAYNSGCAARSLAVLQSIETYRALRYY